LPSSPVLSWTGKPVCLEPFGSGRMAMSGNSFGDSSPVKAWQFPGTFAAYCAPCWHVAEPQPPAYGIHSIRMAHVEVQKAVCCFLLLRIARIRHAVKSSAARPRTHGNKASAEHPATQLMIAPRMAQPFERLNVIQTTAASVLYSIYCSACFRHILV
jgi:hypothetical protein